jgi:hypothetical protein
MGHNGIPKVMVHAEDNNYMGANDSTVTYRPTARQRLGKHIPTRAYLQQFGVRSRTGLIDRIIRLNTALCSYIATR